MTMHILRKCQYLLKLYVVIYSITILFNLSSCNLIMKRDQKEIQLSLSDATTQTSSLTQNLIHKKSIQQKFKNKKSRYPEASHILAGGQTKPEVKESQKQEPKKKKEEGKKDKRQFSWPIWKKLFQYSMKRKYHLILSFLLNILFAMTVSVLPLTVGKVLDQITVTSTTQSPKNTTLLRNSIVELAVLTLMLVVCTYARFLSLQFLQEYVAIDMRNDFYRKFMNNDMYFFQQYKTGQLVSRLSSDVKQAKSAVSNNLTFLLRNLVIIVTSFIVLFTINIKLTFLVMLIVPIYLVITVYYSRRNKILVRQAQDNQAKVSAEVAQKFSGVQLVKAFSNQENQIKRYGGLLNDGFLISKKKIFLQAFYSSCSEFLPYLAIMMVLWYGGQMVLEGSRELTAGQLTSFILYCRSLSSSTASIANSFTNIINGTYAVQKVFQMLEYKPLVEESVGQEQNISGELQFKNVTFHYPLCKTIALQDVSFKINKGEYVAFVGESGSGKSTVVKLIQKFYKIESGGNIRFGDHLQDKLSAVHLRRQIGLVNQEATMFSGTIKDNIVYGVDQYTDEDIQSAAERAGCMEFLNNSQRFPHQFLSEVGQKGHNLSGGQKQRIAIARALMRQPKIIIFDQATSALDSNSQRMVQQSIQNLAGNQSVHNPTIIVIAHRLSTIMNADRIFVMKNGEIQESGSHSQLLQKRGYYFQLIQKQL